MSRFVAISMISILVGCTNGRHASTSTPIPSSTAHAGSAAAFAVTSTDLASGHWPTDTTCDGADNPPELHWTAGPAGTASYALQVFDPDAPNGGFTHWMLVNEPANLRQPAPFTGVSGKNDFGKEGYAGPCPPNGTTHHYVVSVYAVDTMLPLERLYRHQDFQRAINGHVLVQASITATYGR